MNAARIILIVMFCALSSVRGNQTVRCVHVGGDVPKPGPVNIEGEGMTIDSAMAGVGMDLAPFYGKEDDNKHISRCPIRLVIFRQGEKTTYDPSVDASVLRALSLEVNDAVAVTDFRKHPEKIEIRKRRVDRMLELGSTEIGDELWSLASLHNEYEGWRGDSGANANATVEYLRKEASRLVEEGKGQKIIDILDLKLSSLQLDGLGDVHPVVKSTRNLIQLFHELVAE